jgi:hypothetical protein
MKNPGEFVLKLFNVRTVAHIQHLTPNGQPGSDAAHRALEAFYEALIPNVDRFAECWMGCEEKLIEVGASGFKLEKDPLKLVRGVTEILKGARAECADEPFLQQIVDDMLETCAQTKFRLLFLK